MENFLPFMFFGGFVVLMIVVGVFAHLAAKKRRAAIQEWAAGSGLSFSDARDSSLDDRYPSFDIFRRGTHRYAYHIMQGQRSERSILAFDFHYQTTSTDSKGRTRTHHHYFSAVIVRSPFPFRPLNIRPENLLDRLGAFFGYDDINFESAQFSRAFCVKSPDRQWAFDVLHTGTIDFLLGMPRYSMQMDGPHLLIHRGTLFDPAQFDEAIRLAEGVLDRLPDYIVRELRGEA